MKVSVDEVESVMAHSSVCRIRTGRGEYCNYRDLALCGLYLTLQVRTNKSGSAMDCAYAIFPQDLLGLARPRLVDEQGMVWTVLEMEIPAFG